MIAVMLERARIGRRQIVRRRVVVLDARGVREVDARRDCLRQREVGVVRHPLVDLVEERGRHGPFEVFADEMDELLVAAARLEHL